MSILLLRIRQCLGWSCDNTQESFHCHSAARKHFSANWRMKIRYLPSIIQSYLFANAYQFGVKVILGKVGRESSFFNLINSWSDLQIDVSQKLVFTVAVLLKENRSFFSKQLGINCTCEQIGLFLISTRGCGGHSWKLLKKSDLFTRTINP